MIDKYPMEFFGLQITAGFHKMMLVVSFIHTALILYYGLRNNRSRNQSMVNV